MSNWIDLAFDKMDKGTMPTSDKFTVESLDDYRQLGWLKPILNLTGGFVAGGAFKNIFNGEPVKDLDIFFESLAQWEKAVKKLKKKGYVQIYKNDRVRAFRDPITGVRLELVGGENNPVTGYPPIEWGTPEETIRNFDFTITKFAAAKKGDIFYVIYHPKFFEHLHIKRLSIDEDLVKPFSTFERVLRYTAYGYKMCRDSKVILIEEMQKTEFESPAQISASLYDGID